MRYFEGKEDVLYYFRVYLIVYLFLCFVIYCGFWVLNKEDLYIFWFYLIEFFKDY